MAKRSYIKAIQQKQSGPYAHVSKSPAAIHAIGQLKSWPESSGYGDRDDAAERSMNPHNWSARKNPICPICHVQKSLSGECLC